MRLLALWLAIGSALAPVVAAPASPEAQARLTALLDAPLLFVKRHSYTGIHIYDTFYKWPPGGGGIYVLENPSAPREQWRIRPIIDGTTAGTLGNGVYTHPELSYDARKLLFCYKGEPNGNTSIYEIGVDGTGLRRITDPGPLCAQHKGGGAGLHDIAPAYLPDGRIVCLSTRPSGLVPCANSGVSILHVMNADGSDLHPISVNFVHEFDPTVMPDGRLLFGRWEYVDKNALTIQSLWTCNPDGAQETALYANNMVLPEAILDARPVPGTHLIVGTLAKHNATPRGAIAFIDPLVGKNDPRAITNLEHPTDPTFDRGDSCEPWPLSERAVVFSGRPAGQRRNVLELLDRDGQRFTLMADPSICLHSPMLIKPRAVPPVLPESTDRRQTTGRFYVQDVQRGLTGVRPGEVKWLRLTEETSRVSERHGGANPFNQTFLLSAALAFSVKNILGIVPVAPDGSAYFEAPAGRALFLQALDGEGRLVQSMRTFVQAAPGTTRSCIGCHEHKFTAPTNDQGFRPVLRRAPDRPQPESWGSGYMDYPGMVQPVLDRHCVACHGGEQGIAAGLDLSGGWTQFFNISYQNLVNRRRVQYIADLVAGIDCMNGTAWWSSQIFKPRTIHSGAAPLAQLLVSGHKGRLANLTRPERDVLMAWMDSNAIYYGSWDYSPAGCELAGWTETRAALAGQMQRSGCGKCHGNVFEEDWFNLQRPELSRILRAPLAAGGEGHGLSWCRERKVDPTWVRLRMLVNGYAHAIIPLEKFPRREWRPQDLSGTPAPTFASTQDAGYQALLAIIRRGQAKALATPRVDVPGATIIAGAPRFFVPPPVPDLAPAPTVEVDADSVAHVRWERSARTIGLGAEVYRGEREGFALDEKALVARTTLATLDDKQPPAGQQWYALVLVSGEQRSKPAYRAVTVPPPAPPAAPTGLQATPAPSAVRLAWTAAPRAAGYHVWRARPGGELAKLTEEPVRLPAYSDGTAEAGTTWRYAVQAVSPRGLVGGLSATAEAAPLAVQEPVFALPLTKDAQATLAGGRMLAGKLVGGAKIAGGILDVSAGGHLAYPHQSEFDLAQPLSLEFWSHGTQPGGMPVLVSSGLWRQSGWFLQRFSGAWRWHVGGTDCDGGKPALNRWVHLLCTYDGRSARIFEDGKQVAQTAVGGVPNVWTGDLLVGQYSGGPGPEYQFTGRLAGVRLYLRAIGPEEAARLASKRPE